MFFKKSVRLSAIRYHKSFTTATRFNSYSVFSGQQSDTAISSQPTSTSTPQRFNTSTPEGLILCCFLYSLFAVSQEPILYIGFGTSALVSRRDELHRFTRSHAPNIIIIFRYHDVYIPIFTQDSIKLVPCDIPVVLAMLSLTETVATSG